MFFINLPTIIITRDKMLLKIHKSFIVFFFLAVSLFAQTGVFKSYHFNGKKSAEISYSNGIYDGISYWYYENGNLKEMKTFANGKLNGWCRSYYESGLLKEEKFVNNGYIEGIVKRYYANGALKEIINYEKGKLIKATNFDYDRYYQAPIEAYRAGNQQQVVQKKADEFLCDAKICPQPLGGMSSIYEKLIYPPDAKAYGLEGIVRLIVTVDKNGSVTDAKVLKGIGLGCDEAAIEAVRKTRFLPGQNDSGPVISNLTINVEFKLEKFEEVVAVKEVPKYVQESEQNYSSPTIGHSTTRITPENPPDQSSQLKEETKIESVISEETRVAISPIDNFNCSGVDVCAKPKDGIRAVINNFKIPKRVRENNVKGNVIVLCDVDETGHVTNTIVVKDLPHGAGLAVEVALLSTKFEPAILNKKPVRSKVSVTVPVDY